jgi:hypothetical protein
LDQIKKEEDPILNRVKGNPNPTGVKEEDGMKGTYPGPVVIIAAVLDAMREEEGQLAAALAASGVRDPNGHL